MTNYVVGPGGSLFGEVEVPGDKSISHRAVILGSLAIGVSTIHGLLEARDVLATIESFRAMGVFIDRSTNRRLQIRGVGLNGLRCPTAPLDLGNSGTAIRLLCGVLVGQKFRTTLTGDSSLLARPMERVAAPLRQMGASITVSPGGVPPLHIEPVEGLQAIDYEMPIPSAQVKSAILLAGLYARGETVIRAQLQSRDHTERMLEGFGYPIDRYDDFVVLHPGGQMQAGELLIPGDFSSAVFFLVAASVRPGSRLEIRGVGMNETRTGALEILRLMGASIEVLHPRTVGGEPVADLVVRSAELHGVEVPPLLVSRTIDEFPALSIAAACARGTTRISGAAELRVKESDRIGSVVEALRAVGIDAIEQKDGMVIKGGILRGGTVDSRGDHRVAMAFAIAGTVADGLIEVLDCANVTTSFPDFPRVSRAVGIELSEEAV